MLNDIKLKRLPLIASGINDDHAEVKTRKMLVQKVMLVPQTYCKSSCTRIQKGMQRVIASPLHLL